MCSKPTPDSHIDREREECGLWRRNDENFWRVGGMSPENLTAGGVVRPERDLRTVYLCGVSNMCAMEHHPEARNKRTFVERTLYSVSTDGGDMVLGNVGDGR